MSNNYHFLITVTTTTSGLSLSSLTYAVTSSSSNNGANTGLWRYSTNGGGTYINIGTSISFCTGVCYLTNAAQTTDLSTTTALQNIASGTTIFLQLSLWGTGGGSMGTGGYFLFDGTTQPLLLTGTVSIARWDFSSLPNAVSTSGGFGVSPYTATTSNTLVVSSVTLSRSDWLTTLGTAAAKAWGASGFAAGYSKDGAITANSYFFITITTFGNRRSSLSSLTYAVRNSDNAPNTGIWRYRINSGTYTTIQSAVSFGNNIANLAQTIDLSTVVPLQNLSLIHI